MSFSSFAFVSSFNYQYYAIGNLIQDNAEGISSIEWTVYGKISKITKTGSTITYSYNASGNRLSKKVTGTNASETWYVRDATGNTMAVYNIETQQVMLKEQHLYGSSRLGINNRNINMTNVATETTITSVGNQTATLFTFVRGNKFFELSNHLGNVLVTVTDKKTAVLNTNGTAISYYTGDVVSANDYAPFGMVLQGRTISSSSYRYGFNCMHKDNEIYGEGNALDFGARIYDPRLARWLSVDPLQKKYPAETPYLYCGANPLIYIDMDGKRKYIVHIYINEQTGETTKIKIPVPGNNSLKGITKTEYVQDANGLTIAIKYTDWYDIHEVHTHTLKADGSTQNSSTTAAGDWRIQTKLFVKKQWYANLQLGEIGMDKGEGGGIVFTAKYGQGGETRTTTQKVQSESLDLLIEALSNLPIVPEIRTVMQQIKEITDQATKGQKIVTTVEQIVTNYEQADLVNSAREQLDGGRQKKNTLRRSIDIVIESPFRAPGTKSKLHKTAVDPNNPDTNFIFVPIKKN